MTVLVWLSQYLINIYRGLAPRRIREACRFEPSCSEYALIALNRYGFVKGWRLTIGRLLRCRPPHGGTDRP